MNERQQLLAALARAPHIDTSPYRAQVMANLEREDLAGLRHYAARHGVSAARPAARPAPKPASKPARTPTVAELTALVAANQLKIDALKRRTNTSSAPHRHPAVSTDLVTVSAMGAKQTFHTPPAASEPRATRLPTTPAPTAYKSPHARAIAEAFGEGIPSNAKPSVTLSADGVRQSFGRI